MARIAKALGILGVAGALLFGSLAYQSAPDATAAAAHAAVKVAIQGFAFSPAKLTVPIGTTVTWTNMDTAGHTVTSDNGAWPDSGTIDNGKSFSFTFKKAGKFTYHCAVHPSMVASITVTGAGASTAGTTAGNGTVRLATAHVLTTPAGLTLYVFAADPKGKSTCYATCAKYWPPLLVAKGTSVAASMTGVTGTFGTTTRTDGTLQLTFDGAPLYTFALDKKAGDLKGQGLVASGGYWWAVVV
jgi:plastocyanin